jgi:hypothetical protein
MQHRAHNHSYLKARQLEQSETAAAIMGAMLESNLIEGAPFISLMPKARA